MVKEKGGVQLREMLMGQNSPPGNQQVGGNLKTDTIQVARGYRGQYDWNGKRKLIASPEHDSIISASDIEIDSRNNPQVLVVLLRTSKTGPFSVGVYLYLGRTDNMLCPVEQFL